MMDLSSTQLDLAAGLYRALDKLSVDPPRRQQFLDHLRLRYPHYYDWIQGHPARADGPARRLFDRYRLVRRLDRRRAETDLWLGSAPDGKSVVVKVYRGASEDLRRQLCQACDALQTVEHPNVVRVLRHGVDPFEGTYCIVSEWVGETTLETRLGAEHPSLAELVDWMCQLADGIAAVHDRVGRLHGDLKPSNVVFTPAGVPKIIDWDGSVPLVGGQRSGRQRWNTGTEGFAAPEQRAGQRLDRRTDVYGLAALLYTALASGAAPVPRCHQRDDWRRQVRTALPNWDGMPPGTEALCRIARRGLRKARCLRYPSALAMKDDLVRVAAGKAVRAPRALGYHWPLEYRVRYPAQHFVATGLLVTIAAVALLAPANWKYEQLAHSHSGLKNKHNEYWIQQRSQLLDRLDWLDDSPPTRELAGQVATAFPDQAAMQLAPVTLDLIAANTVEQHNAIPEQVARCLRERGMNNVTSYCNLFTKLTRQHELLTKMIEIGFGEDPRPRQELQQLEGETDALLTADPALRALVDALPTLTRLCETVRIFNQTCVDEKPIPDAPGLSTQMRWLYWQGESLGPYLETHPNSCAELHYQRIAGLITRFTTPDQPVAMQALPLLARVREIARQARSAPALTRCPVFDAKTRTFEAHAGLALLRSVPDLGDQDVVAISDKVRECATTTGNAPVDAQLFIRFLIVQAICEGPLPAHWVNNRDGHQKRVTRLNTLGSQVLLEWEDRETSLWPTRPENWSSDFLREKISEGLVKKVRADVEEAKRDPIGALFRVQSTMADDLLPGSPQMVSKTLRKFAEKQLGLWYRSEAKRFLSPNRK